MKWLRKKKDGYLPLRKTSGGNLIRKRVGELGSEDQNGRGMKGGMACEKQMVKRV